MAKYEIASMLWSGEFHRSRTGIADDASRRARPGNPSARGRLGDASGWRFAPPVGIEVDIDDVVQHAHGGANRLLPAGQVQLARR